MKKSRTLCGVATLIATVVVFAYSGRAEATGCYCTDSDRDGRYGLVRVDDYGKILVLAGDYGTRTACERLEARHVSCKTNSVNYCRCEDRDRDGRYGIVRYDYYNSDVVLDADYGSARTCTDTAAVHQNCGGRSPVYCRAEDRDRDGRFGVVRYDEYGRDDVVLADFGSNRQATAVAARSAACR